MVETITRDFEVEFQTLKGERAILARINTDAVDRYKTVIDPLGGDTRNFNKTASVFWEHGKSAERGTKPIGHGWAKTRRLERDMLAKTKFAKDDFSQGLFELCEDGHLRSWSINATVQESSPPTIAEKRARPELEGCDMIYRKWELTEYSLVSIPGNADATTIMVSRGLIAAPEGFVMPEPVEVVTRTERYIESDGSVWRIFEPDGKPVIAFADPELAEECLRLMDVTPKPKHEITRLFGEIQAIEAARQAELKEYIDLYQWGRI